MSYAKRRIDIEFRIGTGTNGAGPPDIVTVTGHRVSAYIEKSGGWAMGAADLRIWGLDESLMNRLATLGRIVGNQRKNVVRVSAGDEGGAMSLVYEGTIQNAWVDFRGAPDVPFTVSATAGLFEAIAPAPPSSYQGSADVATIMAALARQMGLVFENNGVQERLSNPYFPGTALDQAQACARAAGINMVIDAGVLAIWPGRGVRGGDPAVISPDTGLVGYPTFTSKGITFRTLFDPTIRYGAVVDVRSSLKPASGRWGVYSMFLSLEAEMPNGEWFVDVFATALDQFVVGRT